MTSYKERTVIGQSACVRAATACVRAASHDVGVVNYVRT